MLIGRNASSCAREARLPDEIPEGVGLGTGEDVIVGGGIGVLVGSGEGEGVFVGKRVLAGKGAAVILWVGVGG